MENKVVKTPLGRDLVLRQYINPRQRNRLREMSMQNTKIDLSSGKPEIKGLESGSLEAFEIALINETVLEYDSVKEKIADTLLDGPSVEEYDFVIQEAQKIADGSFQKAK